MTQRLHTKLSINGCNTDILARVKANKGNWSSSADGVLEYRDWLHTLQNFRCAYCQCLITTLQVGHCEIDHILPKDESAHYGQGNNKSKALSDIFEDRRHTSGYPAFTFEPQNLTLICKQCNSCKGSFDPRRGRNTMPHCLPVTESGYTWVHPHFSHYDKHIEIDADWIYHTKTDEGRAVLNVCKLNEPEVVSRKKQAEVLRHESPGVEQFILKYLPLAHEVDRRRVVWILQTEYLIDERYACEICDVVLSCDATASFASASVIQGKCLAILERAGHKPLRATEVRELNSMTELVM